MECTSVDYTAAIELDAECAEAWVQPGRVVVRGGDYPQSIADLTEAIRLDPEDYYFSRRSLSYLFNDQPEEA